MDGQVELLAVSSSVREPKIITNNKTNDSVENNRRFSSLNKGTDSSSIMNYDFLVNKNR